jgi:hypothetical protein
MARRACDAEFRYLCRVGHRVLCKAVDAVGSVTSTYCARITSYAEVIPGVPTVSGRPESSTAEKAAGSPTSRVAALGVTRRPGAGVCGAEIAVGVESKAAESEGTTVREALRRFVDVRKCVVGM